MEPAAAGIAFGDVNPHVIASLMKEAVRRAMLAIRNERFSFEARTKGIKDGGSPDLVTTADGAAQRVYVKLLRDWFPTFGIVAEEDHLSHPCTHPRHDLWFTVDPLDGTSAFVRRQSHGIGTMLALICDGEVICACIGDVMTQEVYTYRLGSERVYRISEFGFAEKLTIDEDLPLSKQWALLRERPLMLSRSVQTLIGMEGGLFRGVEVTSGSIGISCARLWKGEVGAALLRPFQGTPWDLCPVVGFCQKLGFPMLAIDPDTCALTPFTPPVDRQIRAIPHELLIVHRSRLAEVRAWGAARGVSVALP